MGKMVVGDSGSVVGLNTHFNTGNNQMGRKGYAALREFAEFACAQDADFVIAGGHSLWFREFFRMFLDDEHLQTQVACRKKIVNCGVVAFTLTKVKHPKHGDVYRIDPDAIDAVYGGFQR
jgi:hypothetical protein